MDEEKIIKILPLMFRQVNIPKQAKENLKKRLFDIDKRELSDDELEFIAAAGNPPKQEDIEKGKAREKKGENENG